jgi:hypothetical protein
MIVSDDVEIIVGVDITMENMIIKMGMNVKVTVVTSF